MSLDQTDLGFGGYQRFSVPVCQSLWFDYSSRRSTVKIKVHHHFGGGDGTKVSTVQLLVFTSISTFFELFTGE